MSSKTQARAAARLAAVQALYQHEMEATALPQLLDEFHMHRLGAEIDEDQYAEAEVAFFDDLVKGTLARRDEIDALLSGKLAEGWSLPRLDKPMLAAELLDGKVGVQRLLTQFFDTLLQPFAGPACRLIFRIELIDQINIGNGRRNVTREIR